MKKLLIAVCAISLMVFWACHLNPEDSTVTLDVRGDGTWLEFDRLEIRVKDTGNARDTSSERLFDGRLNSLDELRSLPAGHYTGGPALFIIRGYRNGGLVLEEVRAFNEATGSAVVETTFALDAVLTTFRSVPESLVLYVGGESAALKLSLAPKYAHPEVSWILEGAAAALETRAGEYQKTISPRQAGAAYVKIEPHGAAAMALRIPVRVVEDVPKLEVFPAKAFISPGGEVSFTVKSRQEYGELVGFAWDLDGDGSWDDSLSGPWAGKDVELPGQSRKYAAAGKYTAHFRVKDGEGNQAAAEIAVEVGERRPAVDLLPGDTVVSIRDEIRFRAGIQEPGGKLEGYIWDWNGDGNPEDAATLSDSSASLEVKRVYPDVGEFRVILTAKDRDGKTGADTAIVRVVLDAPKPDAGSSVTAKTGMAVAFNGSAFDSLGRIVKYKWDFEGDGTYDDSSDAPPSFTHIYGREADYPARFSVRDDDGNVSTAVRMVKISDVPFVVTAKRADTTISIKDNILMTASIRNEDGKALVYAWDYDGDGAYEDSASGGQTGIAVSKPHVYATAGRFKATFRVVDSQGKELVDTVNVTVVLDAPKADLGKDDTVLVGSSIAIRLLETANKFGSITKRELRINDTVWTRLSNSDTVLILPMAEGVFRVIGRVTDDDSLTGVDTLDIAVKYPAENRLSGIFITPGALSPVFDADSLAYAVSVANAVTSVALGGAARDPKAEVRVNGGAPSATPATVPLKPGLNSVPIVVTAQDSAAKRTYMVNITRALSENSFLSNLVPSHDSLNAKFAQATLAYAIALSDTVDSLQVTVSVADTASRMTVAGKAVSNGAASQKIATPPGSTAIAIVVTAGNGSKRTYAVTAVRKVWSLAGVKGFATTKSGVSSLVADKGVAYVAFTDNSAESRPDVWKWDNTAWTGIVGGAVRDSGTSPPALDIIAGVPWMASVVYYQSPAYYINIRKYAGGTSWISAGNPVSGAYSVYELGLGHDKADKPYFSYHHSYKQNAHFLFKHADTAWTLQPYAGSIDSVFNLRMAVNPITGFPALAYTKSTLPIYTASAVSHNGTGFAPMGSNADWPVANSRVDLAYDSLGSAYYAYVNAATGLAAVRKFTTVWTGLGPVEGFSQGEASSICVAAIGSTPVVAYRDAKLASVVVKYWNGSAWAPLGDPGFKFGDAGAVRLAVDNTAVWIALSEVGTSPRVTVMRRPLP
jgi:cadherin-like protein/PKD domain-containing protein